jgi:hypothetical protein
MRRKMRNRPADKILIANFLALRQKYEVKGYQQIRAALERLIAKDNQRNLQTHLVGNSSRCPCRKLKLEHIGGVVRLKVAPELRGLRFGRHAG